MKRRKTYNKYTIGEHGQIIDNEPPRISQRTQTLLQALMFGEALQSGLFTDGESYTGEGIADDVTEEEDTENVVLGDDENGE